jgi:hypothetical protein
MEMAIKEKRSQIRRQVIDLTGPEGNAFCLMGMAKRFADDLDKDGDAIVAEMRSGDYENLIKVFDREFGEFINLER